jgi:hypothetical protein
MYQRSGVTLFGAGQRMRSAKLACRHWPECRKAMRSCRTIQSEERVFFGSCQLWFSEPLRSFFKEVSANDMVIAVLWDT